MGGSLDLSGTSIKNTKKVKRLSDGDYVEGKYIYCDQILTHIKRKKHIGKYEFYIGKIKNQNVISDGVNFAHCESFKAGVLDLEFKKCKERGVEQYNCLTLESELSFDESIIAYRIITGACQAGTKHFVENLPEFQKKEKYKISEIIEITKGAYGNTIFENFFKNKVSG